MVEYGANGEVHNRMPKLGGDVSNTLNLHGQIVGSYQAMDLKVCRDVITLQGNDYMVIYGEEKALSDTLFLGLSEDRLLVRLGSSGPGSFL